MLNFPHPDRNLALELVRATEAAAIRSYPFIGKGDKNAADQAHPLPTLHKLNARHPHPLDRWIF